LPRRSDAGGRARERYAEDHAGVCLIFHRDKLEQRIRTRLSGKRGTVFFGDVDYTQMGLAGEPGAQSLKLDREAEGLTTEALAKHLTEHHRKLFFLKTLDWQTENEYRFVAITSGRANEYVPFSDALAAVVVGEKFPIWQVAGALETCKQAKVDALALGWFDYRPRIRDLVVPKRVRKLPRARSKTPQKEDPPRPPSP
jgi:hypothetical protein